jgi:hypothetical protein
MEELHDFQPSQLANLLAKETITYYKLIGYGASVEECTQCNNRINEIRSELDSRRSANSENIFQHRSVSVPSEYLF